MVMQGCIWAVILAGSLTICLATWLFAFWLIGAHLDYRADKASGFVVLRLAPEAGVSYQWSNAGMSLWFWRQGVNERI